MDKLPNRRTDWGCCHLQDLLKYIVGDTLSPPRAAPLLGVASLDFDPILDIAGLTASGVLHS